MACSNAAEACSCVTVGKSARNSDRLAAFEVVEERLEGYPSADEDGGASHDFGVDMDHGLAVLHR